MINLDINIIPKKFKLPKKEKLCSQIQIDYLFANSSSFFEFPIKFNWCIINEQNKFWLDKEGIQNPPIINIFATSKKYFKRAVKRNRCKRIMRECYRLNNHEFKQFLISKNKKVMVSWSYLSKNEPDFSKIEKSVNIILNKCIEQLNNA